MGEFFDDYYPDDNFPVMRVTNQTQIFDYAARDIMKNIKNHIVANYVTFVQRFVNVFMNKKETLANLPTVAERRAFNNHLKRIKTAMLDRDFDNPILAPFNGLLGHILPVDVLHPDNVIYDLKRNPMAYFERMLKIMRYVESREEGLNQILPQRTTIIPAYICIDTAVLVDLLEVPREMGMTKTQVRRNRVANKQGLWGGHFKTDIGTYAS